MAYQINGPITLLKGKSKTGKLCKPGIDNIFKSDTCKFKGVHNFFHLTDIKREYLHLKRGLLPELLLILERGVVENYRLQFLEEKT